MLKDVGASGQISLGKRCAKQLFEVIFRADGWVELLPMRATASARLGPAQAVDASDGWLPPGGCATCTAWALDNRAALQDYARRVEQAGTAAAPLQQFLGSPDGTARL